MGWRSLLGSVCLPNALQPSLILFLISLPLSGSAVTILADVDVLVGCELLVTPAILSVTFAFFVIIFNYTPSPSLQHLAQITGCHGQIWSCPFIPG